MYFPLLGEIYLNFIEHVSLVSYFGCHYHMCNNIRARDPQQWCMVHHQLRGNLKSNVCSILPCHYAT